MYAQAGLRLCCSQTPEDRFSRVKAHIWTESMVCWLLHEQPQHHSLPYKCHLKFVADDSFKFCLFLKGQSQVWHLMWIVCWQTIRMRCQTLYSLKVKQNITKICRLLQFWLALEGLNSQTIRSPQCNSVKPSETIYCSRGAILRSC